MKMILLAATLMMGTSAFANNVDLKFCNKDGKKIHFQVQGTKAVVTADGLPVNTLTVNDVMNVPGSELTKESKKAGETLLQADVYTMSDAGNDGLIFAVMTGKSGAKYLGTVLMDIDVLGSTKLCK